MELLATPASWGSFPLPLYQSYRWTLEYSGGDSGLLQRVDYKRHLNGFFGGLFLCTLGEARLYAVSGPVERSWGGGELISRGQQLHV